MIHTSQLISEHSLLLLLSAGTLFTLFWLLRYKDRLRMRWWAAIPLAVAHTLVGVLTVKVFAVLETLDLSNIGNMSLFGGVFFMPLAYFLGAKLSRRDTADVFDVFTPCMVFTVMCARINCIISGCCHGTVIPGTDGLQWPTREAEILYYLILLVILYRKTEKQEDRGLLYPIYMMSYGAVRFFIEGFRASSSTSIFHISHIWAAIAFCLGLSIYIEMKGKKTKSREDKKGRR